jgi:hypothetical protein
MDDGDKHQVKTIPHMTLWIRGAKKRHYLLVSDYPFNTIFPLEINKFRL